MVVECFETGTGETLYHVGVSMSFNWAEYFNVAQELAEQAKSSAYQEAKVRAAISRAYYAAFGMARNHLRYKDKIHEPRPLVDRKGNRVRNIHEYVRERFKSSSNIERVEIGEHLERLS